MVHNGTNALSHSIRQIALEEIEHLSDTELVEQFLQKRESCVLEILFRRHGPLVQGVCNRTLSRPQDREDVFQATFLVLLEKMHSIRKRASLGSWLYGVTLRLVYQARRENRKHRGQPGVAEAEAVPSEEVQGQELGQILDEEINRLSKHHRDVILLCHVEGRTTEEAATTLGCPVGTIKSRLSRAREKLRQRLQRRGVSLHSQGLPVLLIPEMLSSAPTPTLLRKALQSARLWLSSDSVSPAINQLTQGAIRTMLQQKLKRIGLVVGLLLLTLGVGWGIQQAHSQQRDALQPVSKNPKTGTNRDRTVITLVVSWTGATCQVKERRFERILTEKKWKEIWKSTWGPKVELDRFKRARAPKIDFQRYLVLALYQGEGWNSDGLEIVSLTETVDRIRLRYQDQSYQTSGLNGGGVRVRAFALVVIPRSTKVVIIEENVQRLIGQPARWKERARFNKLQR